MISSRFPARADDDPKQPPRSFSPLAGISFLLVAWMNCAQPVHAQVTLPWFESFEAADVGTYTPSPGVPESVTGLTGVTVDTDTAGGRVRTDAGTGFYRTGERAITMDDIGAGEPTNYLVIELDLSTYNAASDIVLLDFSFMQHGEENDVRDRVWVRGSNANSWLEIYDLTSGGTLGQPMLVPTAGVWTDIADLDVSTLLDSNSQNFSTTFQVRFGQMDNSPASVVNGVDGITFDDVYLHTPISLPYNEGFEGTAPLSFEPTTVDGPVSIAGAQGIAFATDVAGGRLRTAAGAGFYRTGSRAATIDDNGAGVPDNSLVLTLDMTGYDATSDKVLLDFSWMHHAEEAGANDRVFIRGSKADSWLEIYDWTGGETVGATVTSPAAGTYTDVYDLEVSELLDWNGQNFSSTFQVRFGQQDNGVALLASGDGLTVDDIGLREVPTDGTVYSYDNTTAGTIDDVLTPCGSPLSRTFVVADSFVLEDVNIGVNVDHTGRGDLEFTLRSPLGTAVKFIDNVGGSFDNWDVLADSDYLSPLDDGSDDDTTVPYYDRRTAPSSSLDAFDGESSNGVWTLEVCDNAVGEAGTFNRARLQLTGPLAAASSIGDRVWFDSDGDGVQDGGEPGIFGQVVELQDGMCTPSLTCPQAITDADGNYSFTGLFPGTYTVVVTNPQPGATATYDSDGAGPTPHQSQLTITTGENDVAQDFGYDYIAGSISVTKTVTGAVAGYVPASLFTFDIDCNDDSFDHSFQIADGDTYLLGGLADNTICTVVESAKPAPVSDAYAWGTETLVPSGPQEIFFDGQTISIAADNPLLQSSGTVNTYDNTTAGAVTTCNTLLTRTINVGPDYAVVDVNLGVNLDHTSRGGLQIWLTSPAGTQVRIIQYSRDTDDNYDVVFSSHSPNPPDDGNADATGAPFYERVAGTHESMLEFNGERSAGIWTVEMCQRTGSGTLNSLQLQLTEAAANASELSVTMNVTGDTAGYVPASTFSYQLDCEGPFGNNFDKKLVLTDGETEAVTGLVVGDTCTLTPWLEPLTVDRTYQWQGTAYAPAGPYTITATSQTVSATLTNPIVAATGTLEITQTISGATAGYIPASTFNLDLDCDDNFFDQSFVLANGATHTVPSIPVTTSCRVIQTAQPATAGPQYVWGKTNLSPGGARVLRWHGQTQEVIVDSELNDIGAVADITGVVFRDYDLDGAHDVLEPGVSGIPVTAYNAVGTIVGTATSVQCAGAGSPVPACASATDSGHYQIDIAGGGPVRLEFAVPSEWESGVMGAGTNGAVQFVPGIPAAGLDFGVHIPVQYCESNPRIAVACYEAGAGTTNNNPAYVSFDWDNDGVPTAYGGTEPNPSGDATIAEVGSIWGAAYQPSEERLFVGAFTKRHVGFGPRGVDGVYVVDYSTSPATVVGGFNLQGKVPVNGGPAIDLGTVKRTGGSDYELLDDPASQSRDVDAFDKVGRTAYGDLEMSEDNDTLWLVNLHQQALIAVDVSGQLAALPGQIRQYVLSDLPGMPDCPSGDFQPFAIQIHQGRGYLGGVCSAEQSQSELDLIAYILSFDPDSPASGLTLELDFDLYRPDREYAAINDAGGNTRGGFWTAWSRTWVESGRAISNPWVFDTTTRPQPMLGSIDFAADGSMVLGLLDRHGHQSGRNEMPAVEEIFHTRANFVTISAGDIIHVCNSGGTWILEGDTGCATSDPNVFPLSNVDGQFSNGEYYYDDFFRDDIGPELQHGEVSLGAVAVLPRRNQVMNIVFDPVNSAVLTNQGINAGGVHRYDQSTGARAGGYVVFESTNSTFGKAAGLGDLERICEPAPVEVGNYIWNDANVNGIMDPGELPIVGVTLTLYSLTGTTLGQAVSSGTGYFRFLFQPSTTPDPSTADDIVLVADPYQTDYWLMVDNANFLAAAPLFGMDATIPLSTRAPDSPRDSNGVNITVPTVGSGVGARVAVARAGENDHTIDFGFRPAPPAGTYDLALRLTSATLNSTPGSNVTFSIEVFNQGTLPAVDPQVLQYVDPTVWRAFSVADNPPGVTAGAVNLPFTWFDSAPDGFVRIVGTVPPLQSVILPVTLTILPSARGVLSTASEILVDDGVDLDSQTETEEADGNVDFAINDEINNAGGDVDDHDFHQVSVFLASVGDYVWLDADGDGWQDPDEEGLSGVTVELRDNGSGVLLATTITDANGRYLFNDIGVGTYRVDVVTATLPNAGAGLVLSGGSSNPVLGIVLIANQAERDVDFGYTPAPGTAAVGDFVWFDTDNDGIQDAGEVGLGSVTLDLRLAATGAPVAATMTAPDGRYWFTGVAPDEYVVVVTDTGTVLTGLTPTVGPESIGAPSSDPFTLLAGFAISTLDYGYTGSRSTITDRLWHDSDSNGLLGGAELGIAGVSVDLLDSGGNVIATVYSDDQGFVSYTGLVDGNYTLRVSDVADRLDGFFGTTAPATASSLAVVVAGTPTTVTGTNFGYNTLGVLGDTVWLDADGDGTQDNGEIGIGGVTLELRDGTGTVVLATTTTAADGTYSFGGLFSATYNVVVTDTSSVLTGMTQTGDPDATLDDQGFASLGAGESNLELDFGYDADLASISGHVFRDLDEDGLRDFGENGFEGVTVALYNTSGDIVGIATTDAGGNYSFPAVPDGDYQVGVTDNSGVLDEYYLTSSSSVIDVTVGGTPINDIDFGYNRVGDLASIGNYVWFDANRDGVQNASEEGLVGVILDLYLDSNNNGVLDGPDTLLASTATSIDGLYVFDGLGPGRYLVDPLEGTLPAGFTATAGTGPDSGLILLSASESYEDADFGYAPGGGLGSAIGDFIFYDANGDGFPDPGEVGFPGVSVTVTGPGGYNQTVVTDSRGYYLVTGVTLSGDYTVAVDTGTLPAGIDPIPTLYPSATHLFGVTAGIDLLYADFGFEQLVAGTAGTIGDTVFRDTDGDGVQDAGEVGIEFVSLSLLDSVGTIIATTSTDANGNYDFAGVLAGTYRVSVADPIGVLIGLELSAGVNPTLDIVLAAGQDYDDADFGYRPQGTGSIGNLVWHDLDGSGVRAASEPGIQGISVQLWIDQNNNGVIEPGTDNLIRTSWTDANGEYQFTSVPFDDFLVVVSDAAGALAGFAPTSGAPGVNDNSQTQPYDVTLSSGSPSNWTADFGYSAAGAPYTLSGTVFFDNDADGVHEPPLEDGVPGGVLYLYRDLDGDGVLDANDSLFGTAVADGAGDYTFTDLPDLSDWIVAADVVGTFLEGGTQTTQLATDGVEPASIAGANTIDHDFGFSRPPTVSVLSAFEAFDVGGRVEVRWQTSSEIGTLGFWLYRAVGAEWLQVNDTLLPSIPGAAQGGVYRFNDEAARPDDVLTYMLWEVEASGSGMWHGPFTVEARVMPRGEEWSALDSLDSSPNVSQLERDRTTLRRSSSVRVSEPASRLRIEVTNLGVQRIGLVDLAAGFGIGQSQARSLLQSGGYDLRFRGESVAWWMGSNDTLLFYAGAPSRRWARHDAYFLHMADGSTVGFVPGPNVEAGATTVRGNEHFEQDSFMATAAARSLDEEFWFWRTLSAGNPIIGSTQFEFDLPRVLESGVAAVDFAVSGATSFASNPDHHLFLTLNGTEIGDVAWSGVGARSFQVLFDSGELLPFGNRLEILATLPPDVSSSVVYVDSFDISYRRSTKAENDRLILELEGETAVRASGFSSSQITVLDVTDSRNPVRVGVGNELGDGWETSFSTQGLGTRLYLFGSGAVESPVVEPAPYLADHEAEYLVLAAPQLASSAQSLADLRVASGLTSRVIDVRRIYDDYGHGLPDPGAIHAFLTQAHEEWQVKPSYAVLVGAGNLDYRDALGHGTNLIPPQVTLTTHGLFASDVMLGDVVASDGLPEIAVGRLPAVSEQEVLDMVSKIEAFENLPAGELRYSLLADDKDSAGNFTQSSETIRDLVVGVAVDRVYLDEHPKQVARQLVLDTFNRGTSFVNYFGHGGLDRLAGEGLLLVSDIELLPELDRAPLVAGLTCIVGRFEVPGFTSLGEALVLAPSKGAVSIWSPSGLSVNDAALGLDQAFVLALSEHETLGQAILAAMQDYEQLGWPRSMLEVYNLLGDPALDLSSLRAEVAEPLFSDGFESGQLGAWSATQP